MIGSFLTRGLVMVFGYAYPAYECFKTVEMNKPDIQQLRFWCQYWILVAVLTVCERFFDAFVSWVPMYSEAKLAFFIYLWCPKTKGTTYVYDSFFRPVVLKHETEIDRSLLELRTRAGDMAFLYWQKSASFVQTRIFDILKYIASQSTAHRPSQPPKQQTTKGRQCTAKTQNGRSASPATEVEAEEEASSESSSDNEAKTTEEAPAASPAAVASLGAIPTVALAETTKASSSSDAQVMQIDLVPSSDNQSQKPPAETVMEEAVRVTRARARKTRLAPNSAPDHVSLK